MLSKSSNGDEATPVAIPLPPMGWSSWNSFSNTVDSAIVIRQAKALVTSGLRAKGYDYVNIDEGWWHGRRDRQGGIIVDPEQWPSLAPKERPGDMSNIVRFIHSLGLKAGIYTDVGKGGCSTWWPDLGPQWPGTGSEGHYDQDFRQFAVWGFDFVKVDWCGGFQEKLDPIVQYSEIARSVTSAEAATGHPLYYSICDWSKDHSWTWAPGVGDIKADMWRTGGDIVLPIVAETPHNVRTVGFSKVLANFAEGLHPETQHTGYYNDPDMLVIGMRGMSESRNRVHMSLWSISAAPLLIGADVTKLDRAALKVLTNSDAIAVDQDALGLQGVAMPRAQAGLQIVGKRLKGQGNRAVVFLNTTASPTKMSVTWSMLGLDPSSPAQVWDIWSGKRSVASGSYSEIVPAHDVVMVILKGVEGQAIRYAPSAQRDTASKSTSFTGIKSGSGIRAVEIHYTNPTNLTHVVSVKVNGNAITKMAFPSTENIRGKGSLTVELPLASASDGSTLTFTDLDGTGLSLQSITLLAGSL
jgi:hypothetical protein